jgi:hypothetical protein
LQSVLQEHLDEQLLEVDEVNLPAESQQQFQNIGFVVVVAVKVPKENGRVNFV